MSLGNEALRKAAALQRFQFDDQVYVIRRNLMVFSSLAIASTFLSPLETSGKYEINLGIIKGVIDNPALIYIFLSITCCYYLIWFYIHCKRLVVNNYNDIKFSFSEELSRVNAIAKFRTFLREYEPKFQGIPSFTSRGGNFEAWSVSGNLNSHAIRNYPQMLPKLREQGEFTVEETVAGLEINYTHNLVGKDLLYLNIHIDQFWRVRKDEWFIALLPIVYSLLSMVLIAIHIFQLSKN